MLDYLFKPSVRHALPSDISQFFKHDAVPNNVLSLYRAYCSDVIDVRDLEDGRSHIVYIKSGNKEALIINTLYSNSSNSKTHYGNDPSPLVILQSSNSSLSFFPRRNSFFPKLMPANALELAEEHVEERCDPQISVEDMKLAKELTFQAWKWLIEESKRPEKRRPNRKYEIG